MLRLRLRLADPDADAVQPHAEGRARGEARPGLRVQRARVRRHAGRLRAHPALACSRHRATRAGRLRASRRRAPACCSSSMPKGFLPSDDTGQLFAFTEAAQDVSFDAMAEHAAAGRPRSSARIRTSRACMCVRRRAAARRATLNSGRMFVTLKPRDERDRPPTRSSRSCGPKLAGHAGHQGVSAEPAGDPHRRAADQEPVSVHAAGRRHRRAVSSGRRSSRRSCKRCPGFSTSPATCRSPSRR